MKIKDAVEIVKQRIEVYKQREKEEGLIADYRIAFETLLEYYKNYKQDYVDLLIHIGTLHEKHMKETEKQQKIIELMAEEITDFLGTCPLDRYEYQGIDCENICGGNMEECIKQCWKQYFEKKVSENK